jgi:hypothetical protein
MTQAQLADWLLDPTSDLGELGTPELLEAFAVLRTGTGLAEACFKAGVLLPEDEEFHGTPPDVTLICNATVLTARDFLATMIASAGIAVGLHVVSQAVGASPAHQSTIAGGGTADHTPNGEGTPPCLSRDFAGNCIDLWSLAAQSTDHVSYVVDPPQYWDGLLCSATYVDPETGEETEYRLTADRLRYIIKRHAAEPTNGKSIWTKKRFYDVDSTQLADFENELLPQHFEGLVQFICTSLAQGHLESSGPSSVPDSPNTQRVYDREGIVGKDKSASPATNYTLVITPDGRVWTAYPGVSE